MLSFRSIRLINTYFKQAEQQFKHMNFNTALELYKEAAKQNPEHFQSRIGQSNCFTELGQYDQAMHILRNLRRRKAPTEIEENVRLNLGRLYKKIGQSQHAYQQFHRAIDLKGKNQLNAVVSKLSCIQPTKQAMEQYVQSLDSLITTNKQQPYHYFQYGWLMYKLKKYDKAIESINRAMDQGLQSPDVLYYRAAAYRKMNKLKECQQDLEKCLKINPNHVQSLVAMGDLDLRQDRHKEAAEWYGKALAIDQKLSIVLYRQALCLFNLGNFSEAQLLLTKSLKIQKKSIHYRLRALARICQSKWSMAQMDLSRTAQSNPQSSNTVKECLAMARIHYRNSQLDLALSCTEKGLQLWPDDANLLNLQGNCLKSLHRYPQALKFLKKASELQPKNINFKYDLAHLYELKGQHSISNQITQSIWSAVTEGTQHKTKDEIMEHEKNEQKNEEQWKQREQVQEKRKEVDAVLADIRKPQTEEQSSAEESPSDVLSLLTNIHERNPDNVEIQMTLVILGKIMGKEDKMAEERLYEMIKNEEYRERVKEVIRQENYLQKDQENLRDLYEQSLNA